MEISINAITRETNGVVVMSGVEFPGVIVQGNSRQEARTEFLRSVDHLLRVQAGIYAADLPDGDIERIVLACG